MRNGATATYLYCLTPGGGGAPGSAIGVDGQCAVGVRACGEIGAVFSEVELAEFCGETAEARLQDLAWLGPRVCRHAAVIEEVMRRFINGCVGLRGGRFIRPGSGESATNAAEAARSMNNSIRMIWMGAKGNGMPSSAGNREMSTSATLQAR